MTFEMGASLFGILVVLLGASWKLSEMFAAIQKSVSDANHALELRLIAVETELAVVSKSLRPHARKSGEHLFQFQVPKVKALDFSDLEDTRDEYTPEEKTRIGLGPYRGPKK